MLAMPPEKRRMWPQPQLLGHQRPPRRIEDRLDPRPVVDLPRHQDVELIRKPDQPAVEHPMRGARQRDPVLDPVRPAGLDWLDMRRLGLGAPNSPAFGTCGIRSTRWEAFELQYGRKHS